MTTIHDIQDLFRLLDANPKYRAALRRYVLTEELLTLPARFERFVEEQLQFNREQLQFNGEQRRFNTEQRRFNSETRRDIGEIRQDIGEIRQDLGRIKGAHARNETTRQSLVIARRMGFSYTRTLTDADLLAMAEASDISDINPRDIDSFIGADLAMEATDPNGRPVYITLEISFTGNRQDTRRAIRNAEFLARFTGQPAYPAIASVRNDPEISDVLDSGQVYWHEIRDRNLEPE